ncbi:MAG TPA: PAS domain S-box protein [Caulobacteraceae bacterium]|nr:PAS domain S-box protein [Caulobacteraceae bacterium]
MPDLDQLTREIAALQQQLVQRSRSLEEAEARYHAVFDTALSHMSICTIAGVVLDVNRAALQAIGAPIEDFVGKHLWESPWFAANPAEAVKVEEAIRRFRGQYVEYESNVPFRNGDWRVCQFILRPYRSYLGGEARFLVLEVRDLTAERRKAAASDAQPSGPSPKFEAQR